LLISLVQINRAYHNIMVVHVLKNYLNCIYIPLSLCLYTYMLHGGQHLKVGSVHELWYNDAVSKRIDISINYECNCKFSILFLAASRNRSREHFLLVNIKFHVFTIIMKQVCASLRELKKFWENSRWECL